MKYYSKGVKRCRTGLSIRLCDPDECDALCEFTARDGYGFPNGMVRMYCPCGREMIYISVEEIEGKFYEPVIKVTPPKVVKINSNPYN
jgi:hypothetical protein